MGDIIINREKNNLFNLIVFITPSLKLFDLKQKSAKRVYPESPSTIRFPNSYGVSNFNESDAVYNTVKCQFPNCKGFRVKLAIIVLKLDNIAF